MVYLPPPPTSQPSYAESYANILKAHRQSPLTSASSVIMLVAPDVDALCAARMMAQLFRQDDVIYRIIPVSGISELERVRDELITYTELHTLILINMGGILDLPSAEWFGDFQSGMTVHVIDSARPQNLSSLFGAGENGQRIVVWDDGGADKLEDEHKAWEALMYEPELDSDEDSDEDEDLEESNEEDEDDEFEEGSSGGKRRSIGDGNKTGKRRRTDEEQPHRMSREERDTYLARLEKYYMAGTWYGQSVSGTIYILATVLERVDIDLLWFSILGLTFQYITSRIPRDKYEVYYSIFHDEVMRLSPPPPNGESAFKSLNPDDQSIRTSDELRFMLYRHWTLYDAMFHSSYVAGKLGIWKERGRRKLTGLLAKMGFSIPQTQQPFAHMDMDLKRTLVHKLDEIAPEYGLIELTYPSFMKCYGYRSQPLSAADAVEGISALLDLAGGVKVEIETEGARNGGEWFGGGKVWEIQELSGGAKWKKDEERENVPPGGQTNNNTGVTRTKNNREGEEDSPEDEKKDVPWWVRNFWMAYDALGDIESLRSSLKLSMALHRAIIRQGTSIIDKQDIRTMRNHRVVVLTQGPDLALFSHPGVLSRLALWLVDALRDKLPAKAVSTRTKRKSLPFVVACLNESTNSYIVVGVMAATDFGGIRKNEFGLAFLDAKERCNARTRHSSFDTSILEINQADLQMFLETLCEGPEAGY